MWLLDRLRVTAVIVLIIQLLAGNLREEICFYKMRFCQRCLFSLLLSFISVNPNIAI